MFSALCSMFCALCSLKKNKFSIISFVVKRVWFQSWVGLGGSPHYSSVLCSPKHEIPKWDLREPSPPPTRPKIQKHRTNSACEILGKLEQVKISDEVSKNSQPPPQQQFQSMLQDPSSTTKSVDNNQSPGFCSNQATLNQIRAIQVRKYIIPNF